MRRQRQLDNDTMNRLIVTNGLNTRAQVILGHRGVDTLETTFNATMNS
jgi:hypothetical protein